MQRFIDYNMLQLKMKERTYYVAQEGDTIGRIALEANVSPVALKKRNGIEGELCGGELLVLPPSGNLYTVCPGDDPVTLCGSVERFVALNGTDILYPGMKVRI